MILQLLYLSKFSSIYLDASNIEYTHKKKNNIWHFQIVLHFLSNLFIQYCLLICPFCQIIILYVFKFINFFQSNFVKYATKKKCKIIKRKKIHISNTVMFSFLFEMKTKTVFRLVVLLLFSNTITNLVIGHTDESSSVSRELRHFLLLLLSTRIWYIREGEFRAASKWI